MPTKRFIVTRYIVLFILFSVCPLYASDNIIHQTSVLINHLYNSQLHTSPALETVINFGNKLLNLGAQLYTTGKGYLYEEQNLEIIWNSTNLAVEELIENDKNQSITILKKYTPQNINDTVLQILKNPHPHPIGVIFNVFPWNNFLSDYNNKNKSFFDYVSLLKELKENILSSSQINKNLFSHIKSSENSSILIFYDKPEIDNKMLKNFIQSIFEKEKNTELRENMMSNTIYYDIDVHVLNKKITGSSFILRNNQAIKFLENIL